MKKSFVSVFYHASFYYNIHNNLKLLLIAVASYLEGRYKYVYLRQRKHWCREWLAIVFIINKNSYFFVIFALQLRPFV